MDSKKSSVIDYPKSGLDEKVWIEEKDSKLKLKEEFKKLILDKLNSYLKSAGFKYSAKWIKRIKVIGSLTSFQWRNDSDLDVHVEVDTGIFRDKEFSGSISPEDAQNLLNETGRKKLNIDEQILLPGTKHNLEFYFEMYFNDKLMDGQSVVEYDGVYDIQTGEWVKPPRSVSSAFDPAEIYANVYEATEKLAENLDIKLNRIKRDIIDIRFIKEALESFKDKGSIEVYQKAINTRIAQIETEINDYMKKMRKVIDDRKKSKSQYDDDNLKFKFLAKYSYIWLEKELEKVLGKPPVVTEKNINDVQDAIEEQWEDRASELSLDSLKKKGYLVVKIFSNGSKQSVLCKDKTGQARIFLI